MLYLTGWALTYCKTEIFKFNAHLLLNELTVASFRGPVGQMTPEKRKAKI